MGTKPLCQALIASKEYFICYISGYLFQLKKDICNGFSNSYAFFGLEHPLQIWNQYVVFVLIATAYYSVWLSGNLQLDAQMKLLTILDSRLHGNDIFFQSVPSLSVKPAKAGVQELIDNLSIVDKQIILFLPNDSLKDYFLSS